MNLPKKWMCEHNLQKITYQIGKWFDCVTRHSWFLPHLVGWWVLISNPDCIRTKAERRKNVRVSHHDVSCSQAFSLPFISHPVLSWAEHDPAMDCQLSLIRGSLSLIWGLSRKNRDGRRQRKFKEVGCRNVLVEVRNFSEIHYRPEWVMF